MYSEAIRDYYARLNDLGGIAGRPVELLWNDYGYDVAKAEQLYSEYVQAGSVMFMGWGTGDTEALRGRIAADRIPFVSASFSHVLGDPSEAPFNFLVGTTYSDQLFILLDYLIEEAEAAGGREAQRRADAPSESVRSLPVAPGRRGVRDTARHRDGAARDGAGQHGLQRHADPDR